MADRTVQMTEKQRTILHIANYELEQAQQAVAKKQEELGRLQALVLDAHGLGDRADIQADLKTGVLTVPELKAPGPTPREILEDRFPTRRHRAVSAALPAATAPDASQ